MRLHLDFETFCAYPIKQGAYGYVEHDSFDVLCMGFALGEGAVRLWTPSDEVPREVLHHIDTGRVVGAHNAMFELLVWNQYFAPEFDVRMKIPQMVCTAAKAAALSLPRALDKCAVVLGLTEKDQAGKRVMMKLSKPRKSTKYNNATRWTPQNAPEDFQKLYDYCKTDVIVEREIDNILPDLIPQEDAVWQADACINTRGVKVDTVKVKEAIAAWGEYKAGLVKQCIDITGLKPSQRQALLDWITCHYPDLGLVNLTADSLDDLLKQELPAELETILKARRYSSATSIGKYEAMLRSATGEGRLSGMFRYHGAGTGRWAGQIVQLHNLPRGSIGDVDSAIELMPVIHQVYNHPAKAISSCIRGMLIADEGKELVVSDYSSIEARIVQWLAGDEAALNIFRKGLDPYKVMAQQIYNVEYSKVIKDQRAVGKQAILGLGYGMGWETFIATCAGYGIFIEEEFAKRVVKIYRGAHKILKKFWAEMEKAALAAIVAPGQIFWAKKIGFVVKGDFLFMILPSGRRLAYYKPTARMKMTTWGEHKISVCFWGSNSQTHQWTRQHTYGAKLVENCTQAVARDMLAHAMLKYDDVVIHVHDELVREVPIGSVGIHQFEKEMCQFPSWADGCPIEAEGFITQRYRK